MISVESILYGMTIVAILDFSIARLSPNNNNARGIGFYSSVITSDTAAGEWARKRSNYDVMKMTFSPTLPITVRLGIHQHFLKLIDAP